MPVVFGGVCRTAMKCYAFNLDMQLTSGFSAIKLSWSFRFEGLGRNLRQQGDGQLSIGGGEVNLLGWLWSLKQLSGVWMRICKTLHYTNDSPDGFVAKKHLLALFHYIGCMRNKHDWSIANTGNEQSWIVLIGWTRPNWLIIMMMMMMKTMINSSHIWIKCSGCVWLAVLVQTD